MPLSTGPTPDWNQVSLRWAGVNLDGTPCTGTLELTYSSPNPLLDDDPTMPVSIYPVTLTKQLTTATIQVLDGNGQSVARSVGYAEWSVPASDDPDIQGFGGTYTLVEKLTGPSAGKGQTRNFVASKDAANGIIWVNKITSVTAIPGQAVSAVSVAEFNQLKAQVAALGSGGGGGGGTGSGVPNDGSVTNAKVSASAAISADKLADGTTNKILTATERTKLGGIATGATVNAADAFLKDRTNHTGTQSYITIGDWQEAVEDTVGAMVARSGGGYDDPNGKLTFPSTGTGGGGNFYAIFGASSARVNPVGGGALPTGASVFWVADTKPAAMLDDKDVWYIPAS